eukprot:11814311-Alexandrium_andersonii.AAC.1
MDSRISSWKARAEDTIAADRSNSLRTTLCRDLSNNRVLPNAAEETCDRFRRMAMARLPRKVKRLPDLP